MDRGALFLDTFFNVLPDLVSNTVEVVKLTSHRERRGASRAALLRRHGTLGHLQFVSPIVLAALIYLVLLWPVVRLISRLERRVAMY